MIVCGGSWWVGGGGAGGREDTRSYATANPPERYKCIQFFMVRSDKAMRKGLDVQGYLAHKKSPPDPTVGSIIPGVMWCS